LTWNDQIWHCNTGGEHISRGHPRSRPKGGSPASGNFLGPSRLHSVTQTVLRRAVKFSTITRGKWRVSSGLAMPPSQRADPGVLGTSYMRAHSMTNNQILHSDKTRSEEHFYSVDQECRCTICLRQQLTLLLSANAQKLTAIMLV